VDLGTALLALGTQVVKSACRLWLGDGFAGDMSDTVTDMLKDQVSDAIERDQLEGMFGGFARTVAVKARHSDQSRFRSLPDNEREAAVFAVAETFRKAELNDSALFAVNLDARALEKHLRTYVDIRSSAWGLSRQATGYFDFLLRECCSYLLEINKTLPQFSSQALTELLRRTSTIEQQMAEVLERMPPRTGMSGDEGFETDYRRQVANELDYMDLFGASAFERNRGYQLSVAYISLLVEDVNSAVLKRQPMHGVAVESVLAESRRIFFRGEAGSGKTTLLQWIAVCAARREFLNGLNTWNDLVPFFLQLRHFADDRPLPEPEEFLRTGAAAGIAAEMPGGWVQRILRSGRGIVLIDGVDEVPKLQRATIAKWLRKLIVAFPESRFVVTSRPAAVGEDWLNQQGFRACFVQPMALPDVQKFIEHWHAAMALTVIESSAKKELTRLATALIEQVERKRYLRQLATNPLMCALLCALNRDRRAELPSNRIDLFRISLEMFLERRDNERRMQSTGARMDLADQLRLLQLLAYWMMNNDLATAERERVLSVINTGLKTRRHRISGDAEHVLTYLLERSGVIREPVVQWIDFIHRSFQEFLAAQAAVDQDDIEALTIRAADEQWRQVVILAAGLGNRRQADQILNRLLHPPQSLHYDSALLELTALGCMETVAEVDPEVEEQIRRKAGWLVPPRNAEQQIALRRLGDFALELLALAKIDDESALRFTTKLAAEIGGAPGLNLLAKISTELGSQLNTPDFTKMLTTIWTSFDPIEFAERILAHRDTRNLISLDRRQAPGISRLTNTENIICSYGEAHTDYTFLAEMPNLSRAEIRLSLNTRPLSIAIPPQLKTLLLITAALPHPDLTTKMPDKTLILSGKGSSRVLHRLVLTGDVCRVVIDSDEIMTNLSQLQLPQRAVALELRDCHKFGSFLGAESLSGSMLTELIVWNPDPGITTDTGIEALAQAQQQDGRRLVDQLGRIEMHWQSIGRRPALATAELHTRLNALGFEVSANGDTTRISIIATRRSAPSSSAACPPDVCSCP